MNTYSCNDNERAYLSYFKYIRLQTDNAYKILIEKSSLKNKITIILEIIKNIFNLCILICVINYCFILSLISSTINFQDVLKIFPEFQILVTYYECLKFIVIIKILKYNKIDFYDDIGVEKYENNFKCINYIIYIEKCLNGNFLKRVLITKSYIYTYFSFYRIRMVKNNFIFAIR